MKKIIVAALTGLVCQIAIANHAIQTGRYTSIEAGATAAQIDPLAAVVQFYFPPSVLTVGEAVGMLLANTGYRLAPVSDLSRETQNTLKMPLPVTDRTLGPITVADALRILMGQTVYRLQTEPLQRTVNFALLPLFQPAKEGGKKA